MNESVNVTIYIERKNGYFFEKKYKMEIKVLRLRIGLCVVTGLNPNDGFFVCRIQLRVDETRILNGSVYLDFYSLNNGFGFSAVIKIIFN
jgi:hypothetical protein